MNFPNCTELYRSVPKEPNLYTEPYRKTSMTQYLCTEKWYWYKISKIWYGTEKFFKPNFSYPCSPLILRKTQRKRKQKHDL